MTRMAMYNDGVVTVYREKSVSGAFRTNVTKLSEMEYVVKLDFSELSIRQQDAEFAEQRSFTLSKKIRTRKHAGLGTKCKAVIGTTLYDVSYIDVTKTEAFVYLEEVRQLEPDESDNTGTDSGEAPNA